MHPMFKRIFALLLFPVAVAVGLCIGLVAIISHPSRLSRLCRRETWTELAPRDQERKVLANFVALAFGLLAAITVVCLVAWVL